MFYGIAGPGVNAVFTSWKQVADITAVVPYCSYRKFYTEEEAWNFVKSHSLKEYTGYLHKYGDTFDTPYLTLKYIIYNNVAYYTVNTKHFGNIRMDVADALVQYRANLILIRKQFDSINENLIRDNMKVICSGVKLFADFIDIDVIVPDHSVFYAFYGYNGEDVEINSYKEYISNRIARVSFSMEVNANGRC